MVGDDGTKVLHLRSRTDGDERSSAYLYSNAKIQFEFDVIESGDPRVIQPAEVKFIFNAAASGYESDVIDAVSVLERTISSGRRDFALARISVVNA